MRVRLSVVLILGLFLGCGPAKQTPKSIYQGLQSEDPGERISAIIEAGNTNNRKAIPLIVDRLTDSNSDVRFFAGIALRKMTGTDLGWNFYDSADKRDEAVQRWRKWLSEQQQAAAATQPAKEPK